MGGGGMGGVGMGGVCMGGVSMGGVGMGGVSMGGVSMGGVSMGGVCMGAVLQGKVLAAFSLAYRTKHHVYHEAEVWAQVAKTSHGLGVTSTSYNLDYTDGANAVLDKNAIERAAKQVEVHKPKSEHQRKRLVGDVLGIKYRCRSYKQGRFNEQWIAFLKPNELLGLPEPTRDY
jgi:hypothetical protein